VVPKPWSGPSLMPRRVARDRIPADEHLVVTENQLEPEGHVTMPLTASKQVSTLVQCWANHKSTTKYSNMLTNRGVINKC